MSTHPLVDQVNRIVGNLLLSEHAVYLPEVGTLRVERRPAQKLSRHRIVPPYYEVDFASSDSGRSLVDVIAEVAQCDSAGAQEIYGRWLMRVRQEQTLTIEGVGTLRQKGFTADPDFVKQLNPRGCEAISVRPPSSNTWLWSLACGAIACGIAACGWILYDHIDTIVPDHVPQTTVVSAAFDASQVPTSSVDADRADVDSVGSSSGEESTSTPLRTESKESGTSATSATRPTADLSTDSIHPQKLEAVALVSGRSYVVLGVFSTEQNAQRAVREAQTADTDSTLRCGVYYYGQKFMAALFSSNDGEVCRAFVAARADRYPDAWCYKAK